MGIEPTPSAWKAEVLPLNYTRRIYPYPPVSGGGGRIRTFEGISRQIYSLLPLAAWVPLRGQKPGIVWCAPRSVNTIRGGSDVFQAILRSGQRRRSPCSRVTSFASPSVSPKHEISRSGSSPCSAQVMACSYEPLVGRELELPEALADQRRGLRGCGPRAAPPGKTGTADRSRSARAAGIVPRRRPCGGIAARRTRRRRSRGPRARRQRRARSRAKAEFRLACSRMSSSYVLVYVVGFGFRRR